MTLATAQAYVDAQVISAGSISQSQVQDIADAGDATTLANAQAHADAGDVATLRSAQSYADAQFAAWTTGIDEFRMAVDERFYRTDDRISRQGAMTAASTQMAMAGAGAGSDGRLAAGIGVQGGRAALSVGYAKKISDRVRINFGGAFSGSEGSAGVGFGIDL